MGAECSRCGNDIYDECGYCKVKDERDRLLGLVGEAQPYVHACITHPYLGGDNARRWAVEAVKALNEAEDNHA